MNLIINKIINKLNELDGNKIIHCYNMKHKETFDIINNKIIDENNFYKIFENTKLMTIIVIKHFINNSDINNIYGYIIGNNEMIKIDSDELKTCLQNSSANIANILIDELSIFK